MGHETIGGMPSTGVFLRDPNPYLLTVPVHIAKKFGYVYAVNNKITTVNDFLTFKLINEISNILNNKYIRAKTERVAST